MHGVNHSGLTLLSYLTVRLLCNAERDLLATAKFLVQFAVVSTNVNQFL